MGIEEGEEVQAKVNKNSRKSPFPHLQKEKVIQVQETFRTPNRKKIRKKTPSDVL
jgi:hypothetical protein